MKKYVIYVITFYLIFLLYLLVTASGYDRVQFIDVGQGDAVLIRYKGKTILIDSGNIGELDSYLTTNYLPGTCKIDVYITTHFDLDHTGGYKTVFGFCTIGLLWFNDVRLSKKSYAEFWQIIQNNSSIKKINTSLVAQNKLNLGDAVLYVLWPSKKFITAYKESSNLNDTSVVLLFDANNFEMLLTGDAEARILHQIDLSGYLPLIDNGLDILKVPHHGSKVGLDTTLLSVLKPTYCVISVGANAYGHPSPDLVSLLNAALCKLLRTDLQGTIEFPIN